MRFLGGLQVFNKHTFARLQPVNAAHLGDVEHDTASDDAVLGNVDIQHVGLGFTVDLRRVKAVVELGVPGLMTQGVQVGNGQTVVGEPQEVRSTAAALGWNRVSSADHVVQWGNCSDIGCKFRDDQP